MVDSFVKRAALRLLVMPGFSDALSYVTDTQATIFMMHRFAVPDLGIAGHDPAALRGNLAFLRKQGYHLVSLPDLFRSLREGQPVKRAVAFTIDDGYFDHAQVAAPVFAEFDCPLTCFVTTGFLDRNIWFWWDRLTYIFEQTSTGQLTARIGRQEFHYQWDSPATRTRAWWDLNLRCQDASERDRLECIERLGRDTGIEVPVSAPPRFAPMSWADARRLESRGVTFGPHTVTHPVLGTTSPAQAEWEITESWARLKANVTRPVPIFCYPNGRSQDIGEREILTVRRLGLWGGVMAEPGELRAAEFQSGLAAYRVPRCDYTDDIAGIVQSVSGLLKVRLRLRKASAA
jgi:peptidoglycan/xylan/chitin deacetylase (PgdA/CDA1 family)